MLEGNKCSREKSKAELKGDEWIVVIFNKLHNSSALI